MIPIDSVFGVEHINEPFPGYATIYRVNGEEVSKDEFNEKLIEYQKEYGRFPGHHPKELPKIDHPDHYAKGRKFEPIDVIEDWELGFCLGNAIKYISRAGRKDDCLNDLLKAKWYLEREIRKYQND